MSHIPPKPQVREDRVSLLKYLRLFRKDILSAQPKRLYGAWMAEFRTPFFRSYLVNQPELVDLVLKDHQPPCLVLEKDKGNKILKKL